MYILAAGINHKTSAIDIREKFYLQPLEREVLLSELKSDPRVAEAFILSTCNRTEIYAHAIEDRPDLLIEALFKTKKVDFDPSLKHHFYMFSGRLAVEHILRVTTGLDSMIIGEKQILSQVKEAFEFSVQRGMMGKTFNILSNFVLQTGRKARSETQIDLGGSSVSWASVMMAQSLLGTLQGKTVLILGSGKMGRLTVEQLKNKGVAKIFIMNRTLEKAQELAAQGAGVAVPFWDLAEVLPQVDVCICSSSCPHYLIDKALVEFTMQRRKGEKLVLIDISLPRNIDPQVSSLKGVSLLTVDDLDQIVEENLQKRLSAVDIVESMIGRKIEEYYRTMEKAASIKQMSVNREIL